MEIVSSRNIDGKGSLAIATAMNERDAARSRIAQEITMPGLVIAQDGSLSEWVAEGASRENDADAISIVGPGFPGTTLLASVVSGDPKAAWSCLHRAATAVLKARATGLVGDDRMRAIASAGPEAIVCGSDGGVLFLPADPYVRALESHGGKVPVENRALWIHPDADTIDVERSFAFLVGTLAYRILAGREPFPVPERAGNQEIDGTDEEFIARNVGNRIFEPIRLARWDIREQAAASIDALISSEVAASVDTLLAFGADLDSLIDPGKAASGNHEDFSRKKRVAQRKRDTAVIRESFVRRHRQSFMIGSVIAFFVAMLAGLYVHDVALRPSTFGMSPEAVILGYYGAIARLDQEIPAAYAAKGVKNDYDEIVSRLFVSAKMREAYEKIHSVISPAALFRGENPGSMTVFGLTRFDAQPVRKSTTEILYDVSYYIWIPADPGTEGTASAEAAERTPPIKAEHPLSIYWYRETVTLSFPKDRWLITRIEPKARTLINGDAALILSKIADGTASREGWAPTDEELKGE
jgi:hypothetical protein